MALSQKSLARIKKNLYIQGSYESLERLEGKTGEVHFFRVRSDRITVWFPYFKNWVFFQKFDVDVNFGLPFVTSIIEDLE